MTSTRQTWTRESDFDGKVVRGDDGWLFLDSDSNQVIAQHTGALRFSDDQLAQWRHLLENRVAWLAHRDTPYYFLVPPNPHSVYADKLPGDLAMGGDRAFLQLARYLTGEGSFANFIYPLEHLEARRDEPVYARTNSHWTDLGAFVAYSHLMDVVAADREPRRLAEDDFHFSVLEEAGDLGAKVDPPEASPHVYAEPKDPQARLVSDNRVYGSGRRIDYACAAAPLRCVVFGDSFAYTLLPFLAESFGRLVFGHLPTFDYALVEEVRPDLVISVMNERFMIRVPTDVPARSLAQWAAEKQAAGDMYSPRETEGLRVDSPTPWSRERAAR
jgi:hypothetical protein